LIKICLKEQKQHKLC